MEDKFSVLSDDVVAHILARFPPKSLLTFKCTCKRWYRFISDPEFQRIYTFNLKSRSSCYPPGIFFQQGFTCCDSRRGVLEYLNTNPRFVSKNILDFLPVTTAALVASSNGILCCRSLVPSRCKYDEYHNFVSKILRSSNNPKQSSSPLVFYICNPATKEWISLTVPLGFNVAKVIGFNFDPDSLSFTIVGLQHSEDKPDWCSFVIYESKLKQWRVSKEFDCFALGIRHEKHVFLNGRCHCISFKNNFSGRSYYDFYMVVFDIREESCQVIKLPHITTDETVYSTEFRNYCLGVSEGHIHYICAYIYEVKIWKLLDYNEPSQWTTAALKFPSLAEFFEDPLLSLDGPHRYKSSRRLIPIYLYNDILFIRVTPFILGSFNMRSGEYVPDLNKSSPSRSCVDDVFLLYWPTTYPVKGFEVRPSLTEGCYPNCTQSCKRKLVFW